jgi:ATP-dependent RNA helicase SUPV3L1/SUV3
VALYQSGDVDFLVATDAIGMGLNLDVDHVAFAGVRKFDGHVHRELTAGELGQIAGRAGRHMNDGTFGTTADVGGLDPEVVEAIENHRFDPLRDVQWRNSDLHFHSVPALIASLNRPPPHAALQRVREQDDQLALQTLSTHSEFLPRLHAPQRVKLLWEVCQVPDFRKTMTEEHTRLLGQLFEHLTQGGERLPEDWIESHVQRLERYDGDIDTLMARIAHVRTWTYISHRPDWIQRATHWQERARAIEDKLSDVLHQRLTQRFVDRRAALLVRRLRDEGEMTTSVAAAGEVSVEGEHLGRIEGFRFVPDATEGQTDQKAVLSAALRALRQDLPARLQAFASSADGELVFDSQLRVCWGGGPIARLLPSGDILAPKVEVLSSDLLDGPAREEVRKRAAAWVETRIRLGLSELMDARATAELPAGARGIIFQLCEGLGVLPRRPIEQQLAELGEDDRKALARLGVRVGVYSLYFPSMLKPVPIRLRAGLWMIARNRETIPPLPAEGRTSMDLPRDAEREFYATIGYLPLGDHAIRADMVERLAAMARQAVRESREAARRAQQEKKPRHEAKPDSPAATAAPSDDEISEWAIVAAAFGEDTPAPAPEPVIEASPVEALPAETAPVAEESKPEETATAEPAPTDEPPSVQAEVATEEAKVEAPAGEEAKAEEPKAEEAKKGPRPLPPGWFRAAPQMMSLVGCSEPEMANVLQGLGYRVHPPSEENGPLHAFSIKPRFVREREEQRERERLQQRQQREQRRRERPERPNERQFFADSPRPEKGKDERRRDGPRQDGPRQEGAPNKGPPNKGPRPEGDRPRDDRRGPRPPRRDSGGPALRLYATTEKKSDTPAADSPFAKLLELKLGGKK